MRIRFVAAVAVLAVITGCAGAPKTQAQRDALSKEVAHAIELAKLADPSMKKFFDTAYGYAVLPSAGKGGFIIAGAGGDGEIFKGGTLSGYCSMGQGTVGATIGGQAFDEFIFFQNQFSYGDFVDGEFALAAQASAVMIKAGGGAAADYQNGVVVFISNTKGAMLEASVGGQQFNFVPLDAAK